MINNDKKMTRGEFLSALGGMTLAAVALKVASITDTVGATVPRRMTNADAGTYGNSAYGGKNA